MSYKMSDLLIDLLSGNNIKKGYWYEKPIAFLN